MITRTIKTANSEATRTIRIDDFEFEQGQPESIERYKKELLNITNRHQLPLHVSNKFGEAGAWCCSDPLKLHVGVGYFWFDEENLAPVIALCHELGHWYDTNFISGGFKEYYKNGTKENEIRAWEFSVYFAKSIGFTEWDVLLRYSKVCLSSYYGFCSFDMRDAHYGYEGTPPTFEEGMERIQKKIKEVA